MTKVKPGSKLTSFTPSTTKVETNILASYRLMASAGGKK